MYNSGDTPIWVNYSDAWIGAPGEPDRDLFAYFQSVNAGWMMPKTCAEIVGGAATDEFLPATYILSTVFYNNQGLTIASSKNMITVPSGSVAVSNPTYDNSSCVRSLYEP
jgi:hypothetical protein